MNDYYIPSMISMAEMYRKINKIIFFTSWKSQASIRLKYFNKEQPMNNEAQRTLELQKKREKHGLASLKNKRGI